MAYFALTVLPAPDSPETMMDWSRLSLQWYTNTLKAIKKMVIFCL
jgi:hypothetical protein